jgi:hypothetical protein
MCYKPGLPKTVVEHRDSNIWTESKFILSTNVLASLLEMPYLASATKRAAIIAGTVQGYTVIVKTMYLSSVPAFINEIVSFLHQNISGTTVQNNDTHFLKFEVTIGNLLKYSISHF